MRIIQQYYSDISIPSYPLTIIERAGRTCYKSEEKISNSSAIEFVKKIMNSGHHSVIEHVSASVRFITDRGVTHEIVRHRLASYSQESTRYCNYSKDKFENEITIVLPVWFLNRRGDDHFGKARPPTNDDHSYSCWYFLCLEAEKSYFRLLECGQSPQQARSVLPNSLKTEIVMTCNLREWRHFFTLRTSPKAHPQMQDLIKPLLKEFQKSVPVIFDGINQ